MSTTATLPTHTAKKTPVVAHHFDDWEQQYDACVLGMWAFLVSEVMFFGGAIGVTADGVEGVDITVPVYQFSETHYFSDAQVTGAYKGAIFSCTGKTNAGAFKGFAPGEVLFLGASG